MLLVLLRHTFITQLPGVDVLAMAQPVLRVTKGEKRLQMNQTLVSPALLPGFESAQTEPRDNNTDFCRLLPYSPAPSAFPVNRPQEAFNFHFAGNKTAVPEVPFIK